MARLRKTEAQKKLDRIRQADDSFRECLRVREAFLNIRSQRELSERTGLPQSTISRRLQDPGSITVAELREILEAMAPADELVQSLFNLGA